MVDLVEHREGRTLLLVPPVSLSRSPPPTSPVFFNPAASLNRDISVAFTEATDGSTFCDAMAGVGARGVRVAKEVGRLESVTLVDFNSEALSAARKSAALNRVAGKCEFAGLETSSYLYSRYGREQRFDYVDVDPFGTPVRQISAALCATSDGGVLSVTSTDTAVLCGVYPRVAWRRYGAVPLNNVFRHETGIRVLAGALVRTGAQLDLGVEPMFAHSTRHYVRLFARVSTGAAKADGAIAHIGHVTWCPACGHATSGQPAEGKCAKCGKKARVAGPLWTGGVLDGRVAKRAAGAAAAAGLGAAAKAISSTEGADAFPPWSFSIEAASSSMKVATLPEAVVRRGLEGNGWRTMRTPFEKTGIKTDAPYDEFLAAVRGQAKDPSQ